MVCTGYFLYNKKWKSKTRVTSCKLQVQMYELRVEIYESPAQIHNLRFPIQEL